MTLLVHYWHIWCLCLTPNYVGSIHLCIYIHIEHTDLLRYEWVWVGMSGYEWVWVGMSVRVHLSGIGPVFCSITMIVTTLTISIHHNVVWVKSRSYNTHSWRGGWGTDIGWGDGDGEGVIARAKCHWQHSSGRTKEQYWNWIGKLPKMSHCWHIHFLWYIFIFLS